MPNTPDNLYLSRVVGGYANILSTKGDLIGADGVQAMRVAVGTDGQVLTADSSADAGFSWQDAGGGGGNATAADWPIGNPRFYALDEDGGSDANTGYSDVSGAAAMLVAVATPAKLAELIPPVGNGRKMVILIKPRGTRAAWGGAYSTAFNLRGKVGYAFVLIRGSWDGANDAAERRECGAALAAVGPNGDGSFTVGAGVNPIQWTIAAGTLPSVGTLDGFRIRWTPNTTTASLRNVMHRVWTHTAGAGATVIANEWTEPGDTPVAGDTFWIERPGAIFPRVNLDMPTDVAGTQDFSIGYVVAGFGCSSNGHTDFSVIGGYAIFSFISCEATYFRDMDGCVAQLQWYTESDQVIQGGLGMRIGDGDYQFFNIKTCILESIEVKTTGTSRGFMNLDRYQIGTHASKFATLPQIIESGLGPIRYPDQPYNVFGSANTGGPANPTTILGPSVNGGAMVYGCNLAISNVEFQNLDSKGVQVTNNGGSVTFNNITGTAGNAAGLDLSRSMGCTFSFEGNSALGPSSGTQKQVKLPGGVYARFTDFAKNGFRDIAGNMLRGINVDTSSVAQGIIVLAKGVFQLLPGMSLYFDGSAADVVARSDSSDSAKAKSDCIVLTTSDDAGTANQPIYACPAGGGRVYVSNASETLTIGAIAYLSATPGIVTADVPPIGEFKLRVGKFVAGTTGASGYLIYEPELIAVAGDASP